MDRRSLLLGAGAATLAGLAGTRMARADALADAKKRGTLIIGMEAAYVPYESFQNGKIVGYDCDVATALCDKIGVKPQFVDTAWAGIIPALYAGKFDCIISAMTITTARAQKVAFSMPYADASNVVLARADDSSITSAADLAGKPIGVQLGSAAATVTQAYDATLKTDGKPGFSDIKQYDHYPEAYQDLANKRTDGVVNSISSLMVVMKAAPGQFKIVEGLSTVKAYFGMAFRQDDTALRDLANTTLAGMKADGSLAKLQDKWFGGTMVTPNTIPAVLP
ncbi:transporter substrate-binding domain-containing protein [Acidisoma silvae]|uniref:Transporter substrate-binding domain-containing protein n=1 Tax=Acidisoma silvae TaxID=2802396 RepID=A0A963YU14_9PROT|nr:transporter substrate-binding domain-containing protein [Acidisoma silvae]MCB8877045.1 transporter substrate-binding domain-containing protein [Acidisoma silvae]